MELKEARRPYHLAINAFIRRYSPICIPESLCQLCARYYHQTVYMMMRKRTLEHIFDPNRLEAHSKMIRIKYNQDITFLFAVNRTAGGRVLSIVLADYDQKKIRDISYQVRVYQIETGTVIQMIGRKFQTRCWGRDACFSSDLKHFNRLTYAIDLTIDWLHYHSHIERLVMTPCVLKRHWKFQSQIPINDDSTIHQLKGGQFQVIDGHGSENWRFLYFPKGRDRNIDDTRRPPNGSLVAELFRIPQSLKSVRAEIQIRICNDKQVLLHSRVEQWIPLQNGDQSFSWNLYEPLLRSQRVNSVKMSVEIKITNIIKRDGTMLPVGSGLMGRNALIYDSLFEGNENTVAFCNLGIKRLLNYNMNVGTCFCRVFFVVLAICILGVCGMLMV